MLIVMYILLSFVERFFFLNISFMILYNEPEILDLVTYFHY